MRCTVLAWFRYCCTHARVSTQAPHGRKQAAFLSPVAKNPILRCDAFPVHGWPSIAASRMSKFERLTWRLIPHSSKQTQSNCSIAWLKSLASQQFKVTQAQNCSNLLDDWSFSTKVVIMRQSAWFTISYITTALPIRIRILPPVESVFKGISLSLFLLNQIKTRILPSRYYLPAMLPVIILSLSSVVRSMANKFLVSRSAPVRRKLEQNMYLRAP